MTLDFTHKDRRCRQKEGSVNKGESGDQCVSQCPVLPEKDSEGPARSPKRREDHEAEVEPHQHQQQPHRLRNSQVAQL